MVENVMHVSEAEGASDLASLMARGSAGAEAEFEPRWSGICRMLSPFLAIWSFRGNTER
jgi:hypothetical protein